MRITQLTVMGFDLNGAVDSGKYSDITIAEVRRKVEDGTILDFVQQRLEPNFTSDLSSLTPLDKSELIDEWQRIMSATTSADFNVERQGLCLLLAYILEGIQQRVKRS